MKKHPFFLLIPILALIWLSQQLAAYTPPPPTTPYIILFHPPPLALNQSANTTELLSIHKQAVIVMEQLVQRPLPIQRHYTHASNGIVLNLTETEAAMIGRLPTTKQILPNRIYQPTTDAGPRWIGSPAIWEGTATGGLPGTLGEGIIIGIIDTGINMDHPSFADIGPLDGYDHHNPLGSYVGLCASDPAHFTCNDKLIGVWGWPEVGNNPEDDWGHGSNVATIAASNFVTGTPLAPTITLSHTLSGVAPHANLIAYDICQIGLGCPLITILAAIDQALIDGVDVINYSISGDTTDPWQEPVAQAFLAARAAGIFVVTSAGNSGPAPGTILSPAAAPWVTTLANTTHNRLYRNALINMSGGLTPPPDMQGVSMTAGHGPAPIVYAANYTNTTGLPDNGRCAQTFPPATWTNSEIVICDAGSVSREQKGLNVQAGGAGGIILADANLARTAYNLPGVNLLPADVTTLKNWLTTGVSHTATISGTWVSHNPANGDKLVNNSSRGPNLFLPDVLKPDLSAPGFLIFGAIHTTTPGSPPEYGYYTGTSQSSPHVAGAAALFLSLHPHWTPGEIESALMSTAFTANLVRPDGVTPTDPFDRGNGRINLTQAGTTGFLLDETPLNFINANPAIGGDPTTLNRPSLSNGSCVQSCQWTRQLRSSLNVTATWTAVATTTYPLSLTITPASFTLAPQAQQTITITAAVNNLPLNSWAFGEIQFTEMTAQAAPAHFPVAVQAQTADLPTGLHLHTRHDSGSHLQSGLAAANITHLTVNTYGLVPPTYTDTPLPADPSPDDPYDAITTTFFITTTIPTQTRRLIAEVITTTAGQMNLYVGLDTGNGLPEVAEEICASNLLTWQASCDLLSPAPGTYWLLLQNAIASPLVTDTVRLATAVITTTTNLTVTGPLATAVSGPFDLRFWWQTPVPIGETWYGAFDIGTDAAHPGNISLIPLKLTRHEPGLRYTASTPTATLGTTVTYTITVPANITPVDLTYTLTATIPAGMTAQPAQPVWTVTMPAYGQTTAVFTYTATLNNTLCDQPLPHLLTATTDNPGSHPQTVTFNLAANCFQQHTITIDTRRSAGSQPTPDLQAPHITALTATAHALIQPTLTTITLAPDPTASPFDNLNDVYYTTLTAVSPRLAAAIMETTAQTTAVYIGLDNGDGLPQADEIICQHTTTCNIAHANGLYWVLVQNVAGASDDTFRLATAVIPHHPTGNLSATGPYGTSATHFNLRLFWNEPALQAGQHWYGAVTLGTDNTHPENLAILFVNLQRHEDDVAYTVSPPTATLNQSFVHTATIQPNVTPVTLTYALTATLPPGLTTGDSLHWLVTLPPNSTEPAMIVWQTAVTPAACNQTPISQLTLTTDNPGSQPALYSQELTIFCHQLYLPLARKWGSKLISSGTQRAPRMRETPSFLPFLALFAPLP
ncbi:MAG: S8 family serine peptidase [Ardenticatenaceae bacterium]|nr:S8 family serine peptidase [Ardenticatenaceae bacterium]